MTSEQNSGRSNGRRRMVGYTQLPMPDTASVDAEIAPRPLTLECGPGAPSSDQPAHGPQLTQALTQGLPDSEQLSSPTATTPDADILRGHAQPAAKRRIDNPPVTKTRMGARFGPVPAHAEGAVPARAAAGRGDEPNTATPKGGTALPAMGLKSKPFKQGVARTSLDQANPSGAPAPSQTPGSSAWLKPAARTSSLVLFGLAAVLAARWLRTLEPVQEFIAVHDGRPTHTAEAPVGIPRWLGWQHFLNMLFLLLMIRTGMQTRSERKPPAYWTAKPGSFFSPRPNTPKKISLTQWLHQSLDVLWLLNGVVFVVLLFATGNWLRIVPTNWDIIPNMASTAIQYASLDWPTEDGWANYNALQSFAYFLTVFVAAPLAILSGIRMSTWWPERAELLTKLYPLHWARALHFPVMLYFAAFTVVHVLLVLLTGALRNLNHMYTSRDVVDAWGLVAFLASLALTAAAWFLTKPLFTTSIAARMGKISK